MYQQEVVDKYTSEGYWLPETFSDIWDRNAREMPTREALCDSKTRLTWSQAKQWIDRLALGLVDLGMKRGDVLALQLPNIVELFLLRVACEKAGVLNFPLGRYLRHAELQALLEYVEAAGIVIPWKFGGMDFFEMVQEVRRTLPKLKHVLVCGEPVPAGTVSISEMARTPYERKYPPGILEARRFRSHEISFLVHTSGSTGLPKVVENAAAPSLCQTRVAVRLLKFTRDDVVAAVAPAARGPNMPAFFYAPLVGARMVMIERFEPEEALKLIERERVTVIGVVPTMLAQMSAQPNLKKYDLSSLRLIFSTGSLLPYAVGVEAEEKLGAPIVQCFGAVDSGSGIQTSPEDSREVRLTTAGKHTYGGEVRIADDEGNALPAGEIGELWLRGPCSHAGYYKNPQATAEAWTPDHWYRTGDLAHLDREGNVKIVGRKKYMIIRGGVNIYPAEIEDKLISHPKVSAAAAVAMSDPVMVERVCVYVVPKPGATFTYEEMVSFLREKGLLEAKMPERLELIDRLPVVAEGQKLDRKALEKDIATKLKSEGNL